jgi:hypothetical protein
VSRACERADPTVRVGMEALVAFAAALLSLRLSGRLAGRWRARRAPELVMWATSLFAYAVASAALAWASAAGWNEAAFRVYYLFGGLLTAPLLGAGSLLLQGRRWVIPVMLAYAGLAVGIAVAEPLVAPISGEEIPAAQHHLDYFPARILALLGNIAGTLAVLFVAVVSIRRRPLAMSLIVAGVAVAAVGSALAGLGAASTAVFLLISALLLYTGFTVSSTKRSAPLPAQAR